MKNKSYIGISFIILIFGIYTVPKVVDYFSAPKLHTFEKVPPFEFVNQKGKTISLFTISELIGIKLTGFEFPLIENSIGPSFIGASNKISEKIASIQFEKGRLLVYESYD